MRSVKNIIEYWRYDFPDMWFEFWFRVAYLYDRKLGKDWIQSPDKLTALADGTIESEEGMTHYKSKGGTAIRWVFCGMPRCLNEDVSTGGGSFCKRRKWHLGRHANSGWFHRW